jgi:hypothetical protein
LAQARVARLQLAKAVAGKGELSFVKCPLLDAERRAIRRTYQTILDQVPEIGALLLSARDETAAAKNSTSFSSYLDRLIGGYGRAINLKSRRV